MEERLEELRLQYNEGLLRIARLDAQRQEVQRTLLRINGAIQVLEELLAQQASETTKNDESTLRRQAPGDATCGSETTSLHAVGLGPDRP